MEDFVENPLSKLALDYWYQVVMVVSIVVFLLAATGALKALPTVPTVLISLGAFWIGVGEWVNHPVQSRFVSGTAYHPSAVLTSHPRQPKAVGTFFLWLGIILVAWGIFRFFR